MATYALRWQGKRRAAAICTLLGERSQAWLQGWGAAERHRCEVVPLERSAAIAVPGEIWHAATVGEACLYLRMADGTPGQLGALLLGTDRDGSAGLAAGVGGRALADLGKCLAAGKGAPHFRLLDGHPDAALTSRAGVVPLAWSLGPVRLDLYADARLCDALLPPVRQAGVALSGRQELIGSEQVALQAVLDLGPSGLQDVLALRPGQILRTRAPLDTPVRVEIAGKPVFSGPLLAAGEQRAVRCTHPNSRRNVA